MGSNAFSVEWEVAHDEGFRHIARRGRVNAVPALAHSVHVDVRGLEPARSYFYRFRAGDTVSPIGRTRTAPDARTSPGHLRYGFASCQHFEVGYFAAYRHLLEEDVDLMLFLGDYIYEGPGRDGRVRRHTDGESRTLVQYRNRHAQYKTDPDLQRLHARSHGWSRGTITRLITTTPTDARRRSDRSSCGAVRPHTRRITSTCRSEWRPVRASLSMRIHGRYDWGALARFHLLDGRQYRTPQACPPPGRGGATTVYEEDCPELMQAGRTMLGAPQMRLLRTGLTGAPGRWHLIAQQTLMARAGVVVNGRRRVWTDAWDGYPAERGRLLRFIRDSELRSVVVLTGDTHVNYVCDLKPDFDDAQAEPVATELCGTSVTSQGRPQSEVEAVMRDNPHIRFGNGSRRGYVVVDVTAERSIARLRVVDDVTDPATGVATQATFAIDAGHPGAQQISG